ncbi:hypothetical protein AJ79_07893 [Helicocarpus griseus UAMH5409]|uniref:AB hydrolase-1 domain-containing protein n=1 Tax=Helicocarpus griseus UAMH5409 TaxID=1447875 RepID=A0A2B7WXY8_9EURO|nr:hypothetical protein AJ79_07893 [Helicocarpus griseus UAMH5409]
MSPKPTLLLIHGAWQSPSVWTFVTPLLENAGYSVYPILLSSPGMVPAAPDFSCDVDAVRSGVEAVLDSGKDVVLVMHSYAGVAGCEALKGFHDEMRRYGEGQSDDSDRKDVCMKGNGDADATGECAKYIPRRGRILHLVFIAAMVMPKGRGLWTPERTELGGFELKDELIRTLDGPTRFYNDLPRPAQEFWSSKLKLQPRPVFFSPLTYPAYLHYPCSYLMCKRDVAVPYKLQKRMAFGAGIARERTEVLEDAGHSPMISRPRKVVEFIRRAVEGVGTGGGERAVL